MTMDQPHDDSEQMMRMHWDADGYDEAPERQCAAGCGRWLIDEDYDIGICKPCRVTEGM